MAGDWDMAATLEMNDENLVNNPFVLGQHVRAKRKARVGARRVVGEVGGYQPSYQ